MVVLCRQCHKAAHRNSMAPRVKFDNGNMDDDEFSLYLQYWRTIDVGIFDDSENCWVVPKADMERLIDFFQEQVNYPSLPDNS
jgi:hypothetical protein